MATVEVRAFGKLQKLFEKKGWSNPIFHDLKGNITAAELRSELGIPEEDVEVAFINRMVMPLSTMLKDGDRVSFVPGGVPSIHRFNLGFYDVKE